MHEVGSRLCRFLLVAYMFCALSLDSGLFMHAKLTAPQRDMVQRSLRQKHQQAHTNDVTLL